VAVHAVALSSLKSGDRVAVFGAGPIGVLTALVARHAGASEVIVIEPSEGRSAVAERLGFSVVPPNADMIEALYALTGGEGADVVFDAAAHPSVAAILPASVRPRGTVVLVGVYKKPAEIDLQAITFKEIKVVGVRVYARADVERAVELIATDALGLALFPIEVFPLEQTRLGFERALSSGNILKVIIDAGSAS
jgi:2-desacetyl-2-hydroxyethyl bacteriochlorophyllide A dehydrogenase